MSGDVSPQALKAQDFAHALQLHTGVEVTLWDERLSTTEAHRHLDAAGRLPSDRRAVIDQVAAVLILQSFLTSAPPATALTARAERGSPAGDPSVV
jgi:putative Holliday junction resolvase